MGGSVKLYTQATAALHVIIVVVLVDLQECIIVTEQVMTREHGGNLSDHSHVSVG